ncbi:MAG: hypothetical protein KJ607_03155 [Bacteroidetes bacterium]|nr:hypothetical protein [Bacteroidota bacterium]
MNQNEFTQEEIILSGLGAQKGTLGPKNVRSFGADQKRKQLIERLDEFPKEFQEMIKVGKAVATEMEYFNVISLGGTSIDLFQESFMKTAGTRNFSNAKLPKDRYSLLQGLILRYRTGTSGAFNGIYPDALANALFTFRLGSIEYFIDRPVASFQSPLYGYQVNRPWCYLPISNVKLIEPETVIDWSIHDAGATLSGDVKAVLVCSEIRKIA